MVQEIQLTKRELARIENLKKRDKELIRLYNLKSNQKTYRNKPWLVYRILRNRFYISDELINHILAGKPSYQNITV